MKYPASSGVLRRLSEHDPLSIGHCDGTHTFAHPQQVYVCSKSAPVPYTPQIKPTDEIGLAVYEPVMEASMPQMFGSLAQDIDALCLTEHQIMRFCEAHRSLLQRSFPAFLLFKSGRLYFVAWAFDYGYECVIAIHDFYRTAPLPKDPYRLVVPEQLD